MTDDELRLELRLSRRAILGGFATATALPSLAHAGPIEPPLRRLCRRMADNEAAARLGASFGQDRDAATLEAELVRRLEPGGMTDAALVEALRTRIRRDFGDHAIVAVQGWRLSETEAYALAFGARLSA